MQGQEFLRSLSSFESQLTSLIPALTARPEAALDAARLLPCGSMRLLDQVVAPGRGHDLAVLHGVEHGTCPNGGAIAPELVSVNGLRYVVFPEQADEKGPGRSGVAMFLKQDVQHSSIVIHRPPKPMLLSTDLDVDLVQIPSGTPTGFPMAKLPSEEGGELDVPLPQRFVPDLDAALVEQFLNVPLAEWEAVVQPQSVADHAQGKTVAVGLPVSYSSPAYRC